MKEIICLKTISRRPRYLICFLVADLLLIVTFILGDKMFNSLFGVFTNLDQPVSKILVSATLVSLILSIWWYFTTADFFITNRRVYIKSKFGFRRCDIPLDEITVIGFGWFGMIYVGAAKGHIRIWTVDDKTEVYEMLSACMLNAPINVLLKETDNIEGASGAAGFDDLPEL